MPLRRTSPWVIAALALALYAPTLSYGFVAWDDRGLVVESPLIRGLSGDYLSAMLTPGAYGAYQPIRALSYAVDFALFDLDAWGYHAMNLWLYALCCIAAWWCLRAVFLLGSDALDLRRTEIASLIAGLLFVVHPLHAEAVAWISGRKEMLLGIFWFACVALYASFLRQPSWPRWAASLVAFTLALLAKPTAVTLPGLLMVLHYVAAPGGPRARGLATVKALPYVLPFWGLALWLTFQTVAISEPGGAVTAGLATSPGARAMLVVQILGTYLRSLLLPFDLCHLYIVQVITHPLDGRFAAAALGVLLWLGASLWATLRAPRLLTWLAAFALPLLPVAGLVRIGTLRADRYAFLSVLAISALAAIALTHPWPASHRRKLALVAALLLGLSGALVSTQRSAVWRDNLTLWQDAVAYNAHNTTALWKVAEAQLRRGDMPAARSALALAVRFDPDDASVQLLRAELLRSKDPAAAERLLRDIVRLSDGLPEGRFALARQLCHQGAKKAAIEALAPAMEASKPKLYLSVFLLRLLAQVGDTNRYEALVAATRESLPAPDFLDVALRQASQSCPPFTFAVNQPRWRW